MKKWKNIEVGWGVVIGHWHIKIGKFWLGFWDWRRDVVGWGIYYFDDHTAFAFGIGEIRWYL